MNSLWQRFQKYFLRYNDIGFTIDISRMRFADDFLQSMGARAQRAFSEMRQLEAGAIANPDERRMVGHYWLRNPGLAPTASLRNDIEETNARIKKFAAEIHAGDIAPATRKFRHLLVIGSGGSSPYNCQWMKKGPSDSGFGNLGTSFSCNAIDKPTMSTGQLSTTGSWSFELHVTDSGSPSELVISNIVSVTVNPGLTAPALSANPTAIDADQSATISTTTSFSAGTAPYVCQW